MSQLVLSRSVAALTILKQWRSIAFVAAMLTGGLLYDGPWLNRNLLSPLGLSVSDTTAHTLPVLVTMLAAGGSLLISFLVIEPPGR